MFDEELNKLQTEAYEHLWNGRFRLALNAAEKVYQSRPDDSESAICLAWALLENGNPMKAMEYANLAVELKGDSIKAKVYRAYLLYRMSIFEGAIADIDQSIEQQKSILTWTYLNKSKSLAGLRKFEEAYNAIKLGISIDPNKKKTFDEIKNLIKEAEDLYAESKDLNSKAVAHYLDLANKAIKSKEHWFSLLVSRKILEKAKNDEAELVELESMLHLFQLKPALKKAESLFNKHKKNPRFNNIYNALKKYSQLEQEYEIVPQPKRKTSDKKTDETQKTPTHEIASFKHHSAFYPNDYVEVFSIKMFDVDEETNTGRRIYYKTFDKRVPLIGAEVIFNNPFFRRLDKNYNCTAVWYLNDFEIARNDFKLNVHKDWDSVIFVQTIGSDNSTWKIGQARVEIYINHFKIAEKYFGINSQKIVETTEPPFAPETKTEKPAPEKTQIVEQKPREVKPLPELLAGLDKFIGLSSIKEAVKSFVAYLEFLKERKRLGLKAEDKIAINAVFLGNPGTGKTTIARMLGDIFYAMGILPSGHVIEVDRSSLVGQYIGETAQKTEKIINDAIGGVLFIDEAYTLIKKGGSQDFGQEAIDILLKRMEDRKGEFVVIVAGYPEEMNSFLTSNPGLKSRFNHTFVFEDYTPDELLAIFKLQLLKEEYKANEEAEEIIKKELVSLYRGRDKSFGNARIAKKLFEDLKITLSKLYLELPEEKRTKEFLTTFNKDVVERILIKSTTKQVKIPINEEALKEALDELQKLVGLSAIKKQIDEMVKLARYLDEQGEDIKKIFTEHILFLGNPGTGKTTVARIYGKIYSALGILPKGHLVETDRQGLVAGYVGQTAEKTTAIIDKSIGGMLFLDEAYALIKSGDSGNDFGKEAIDILLKRMEDDRGKFIVIAAGYTDEMNRFVASNPGMQSRFSKSFFFEDYSPSELMEIAKRSLARDKKVLSGSAEEKLFKHFEDLFKNRDKKFGNARIVRNILEAVKQKMLLRLSDLPATERTIEKHYTVEGTDISEVLTQEIEAKQFEVKGDPLILQEHINELNKLIGLEDVKKEIFKLISFFKISQLKKEKGLHSVERNLNSIFIGNEGVGKRTVVNILAKILKELGVLKKEQVVEVERHDLIGGYPGQTEIKTDKVIQQAFGGILFVKDAKALFDDNSFGKEAVETIFKRLFDYKNKFILVLSGTKSEIELIFKSDPSIKAKLPNHFYFEDFTPREMLGIASNIAEKKGYSLDEGALQELLDLFSKLSASKKEHLNNVVLAKHLFYAAVTNQEERIFNMYEQNDVDLTTITLEDVEKINL